MTPRRTSERLSGAFNSTACRHVCHGRACAWCLVSILLIAQCASAQQSSTLPHVDDCGLCMKCVVDAHSRGPAQPEEVLPANFQPQDVHSKQVKPTCAECRGCTTELSVLSSSGEKIMWNRTFNDEAGASPNWLFLAPTRRTKSGKAIVKLACIPVAKHKETVSNKCFPQYTTAHAQILLAIDKLVDECQFREIVPKVWVEHVSAIIPGVGFHVRWLGIWMEQADGVSLENLVRLGKPMMHPDAFLNIMHTLSRPQIVKAALFDLLTSQCDRHAQNVFINEGGGITLIDNERALFENNHSAVDSIFLPTTKKFMINVMENSWVNKFANWGDKIPRCWANPPLLFDYRCHVHNQVMGKQWTDGVKKCLTKLKVMTAQDIYNEYHLPNMITAHALKNRSEAMYDHGFEYALTTGYPRNPNPWRYKFVPPCCRIIHTDTYRCAHPWNPDTALPFGDVVGGGRWKQARPDPGSYEGGSAF